MQIKFTVLGKPETKERPKFNSRTGKAYTPKKTKSYESIVSAEYFRQCSGLRFVDREPLAMHIRAYYSIPASTSKKRQQAMEAGEVWPTKRPDADNIIKVVADALNDVAYYDDADLVRVSLEKFYSRQPRLEIEIESLEV